MKRLLVLLVILSPTAVFAAQYVNPVDGAIEEVYVDIGPAGKDAVFYRRHAATWTEPERISRPGHDCDMPDIFVDDNGVYVAYIWYGPKPLIHLRVKEHGGKWLPVIRIDPETEKFKTPYVAVYNKGVFVLVSGEREVVITRVTSPLEWEDIVPINNIIIDFPSTQSEPMGEMHFEGGKLWIDYVDMHGTALSWSKHDWNLDTEPIVNDDIPAARERVRDKVLMR